MCIERRIFAWAGMVLLLSWACLFVHAESTVEEAPAPPKDVLPLPPELAARMKELCEAAEKYRGLNFKRQLPFCCALDEPGLKKKMLEAIADELPAPKMNALESGLKAFGLIPEKMDLAKYYPELLTSQVGGYYDPKQRYLVLVRRASGLLPPEVKAQYGDELSKRMEETVLVHELTHALQDKYFNLKKFLAGDPLTDEAAARLALVEGDATLTMYNFFSGMSLEEMPMVEQLIKELLKDPQRLMDMSPDLPSAREMAAAPAWFKDMMFFTYLNGYLFCMSVKRTGGQKLLDYAFTTDPPLSSSQILHPEKWHTKRSDPILIGWPDLSRELPGYKKASEGQLGEIYIKTLLKENMKNKASAEVAGEGWAGDRFAVYERNGARVLAWITEWDSETDSARFQSAAALLGADWRAEAVTVQPKRVLVIRGKLKNSELEALKEKLAAAQAVHPANKGIDFQALGIEPGKETAEGGLGDLLNNPLIKDIANKMLNGEGGKEGDFNLGELMNDPQVQKLLKGEGGKEGGLNLGELINNPQMQGLIKNMLEKEQPQGEVSQDGRTYTNGQLGFSIRVPDTLPNWNLSGKPGVPMALVAISSPDSSVQINVLSQTMPLAVSLELIESALEIGPQMLMQDYKKISGGVVEKNGKKGYELQYEGTEAKQKLHALQRVFPQGASMLVLSAVAPAEKWRENEKAILETLSTFNVSEPKPEATTPKSK